MRLTESCGQAGRAQAQTPPNVGIYLPEWVRRELLKMPADFTGRIEVNLFKGGVSDIHVVRRVIGPKT